jgi:hypothetical protein
MNRRHDPFDPRGISDFKILDGDVDINPNQNPFAMQIHVVQRFPAHIHPSFASSLKLEGCFAVISPVVNAPPWQMCLGTISNSSDL